MADPIRTPDPDTPGWFLPPFKEGWWYQGITYPGHSDFAVDFNRRTHAGGWLDDRGDPVLAAADGTVKETVSGDGYVLISHPGGYQTEYRHMQPVRVKPGDKVQRGELIGNIGEAGNAPNGTHLHHKHLRNGKPIKMAFEGKPLPVSVGNSDTRPSSWKPPAPVMVQGPQPPASWKDAYVEAMKRYERARDALDAQKDQTRLATDERDDARRRLAAAEARVKELESLPDCADARATVARLEDMIARARAALG